MYNSPHSDFHLCGKVKADWNAQTDTNVGILQTLNSEFYKGNSTKTNHPQKLPRSVNIHVLVRSQL